MHKHKCIIQYRFARAFLVVTNTTHSVQLIFFGFGFWVNPAHSILGSSSTREHQHGPAPRKSELENNHKHKETLVLVRIQTETNK